MSSLAILPVAYLQMTEEEMTSKMSLFVLAFGAIVGLGTVAHADRYDRRVMLENNSTQTIESFRATNVGRGTYGRDLLGNDVLYPGESVVLDLNDWTGYCRFDFRTAMGNGQVITRPGVDICTLERYTIS
jgi:hypothetical protein